MRLDSTSVWRELHVPYVVKAFGDFYCRCSCGAISLPCVTENEARQWVCPVQAAELTVAHARARWDARVRDAQQSGYPVAV